MTHFASFKFEKAETYKFEKAQTHKFQTMENNFADRHPNVTFILGAVLIPVFLVAAVALFTIVIALPLGLICGWL